MPAEALHISPNGQSKTNDRCCREKMRLLSEYRNAANLLSARIALIAEIAGGLLPKCEFALLSKEANVAHEKCIEAGNYFYKHMEQHGC